VNNRRVPADLIRSRLRAQPQLVRFVRWRRDVWGDLRLRLLADLGYAPSHRLRNFFYRRSGVVLPRSSSVHWRAEFLNPAGVIVGEHSVIGDTCFLDGRYAWIASHAIILPGVTIGEGAVVAAAAVVTKDVAPYTLVAGNPARFVRERSRDLRYQLGYAKRFV
jgi:acetyltransferase-like isoleucine patch superfamily enzyme